MDPNVYNNVISPGSSMPTEPKFLNLEYFFNEIYLFFNSSPEAGGIDLSAVASGVKTLLFILAIFFLTIIIYCLVRFFEIHEREHEYVHHQIEEYRRRHSKKENTEKEKEFGPMSSRWQVVEEYMKSNDPDDWKLAIIEADVILFDMLDELGFAGEDLGEKLKLIDRNKFPILGQAWEAHITRNKIAHEGSDFDLTEREARRAIGIYSLILKEFRYI